MIVRSKDLRNMSGEDVQKKMNEIQAELIRQKGKKTSGGTPENPGRMKALRRSVARIITIQKEMEMNEKAVLKAKPKESKPAQKPKEAKPVEKPKAPVKESKKVAEGKK